MSNQTQAPEQGTIEITVTNLRAGREKTLRIRPDWAMDKVRDHCYNHTQDKPRDSDRFTGADENKLIDGGRLEETYAAITAPTGYLPNERQFYIRGPVGGA